MLLHLIKFQLFQLLDTYGQAKVTGKELLSWLRYWEKIQTMYMSGWFSRYSALTNKNGYHWEIKKISMRWALEWFSDSHLKEIPDYFTVWGDSGVSQWSSRVEEMALRIQSPRQARVLKTEFKRIESSVDGDLQIVI